MVTKEFEEPSQEQHRDAELEKYRKAALVKEDYLLRRQRKEMLEHCRRVAIVGARSDPNSTSYVETEKLLGLGVEVVPVSEDYRTYIGVCCYPRLLDIPGAVDLVQIYPDAAVNLAAVAKDALQKKAKVFWVEEESADQAVRAMLADGGIHVVEHENLVREYIKHSSSLLQEARERQDSRGDAKVADRMTLGPVTVHPSDGIKDALAKMKTGRFRHLPVVDEDGKLIGMLSDRDIRLIRPSLAFVKDEDAALQIWSTAVRQAMVFDPVTIAPDAPIEAAAKLMLRWEVGALPVVKDKDVLVGVITYTDLLRELATVPE
jgi:CBS domain-containing protein